MELQQLNDDDLEAVLLAADTPTLGNLLCTCKRTSSMLSDPGLLRRLATDRGFKATAPEETPGTDKDCMEFFLDAGVVESIEALSVLEAMAEIRTNHINFHLASLTMTQQAKQLVARYADLLGNHPRLCVRIDSHTGVGAPPQVHASHLVSRC